MIATSKSKKLTALAAVLLSLLVLMSLCSLPALAVSFLILTHRFQFVKNFFQVFSNFFRLLGFSCGPRGQLRYNTTYLTICQAPN